MGRLMFDESFRPQRRDSMKKRYLGNKNHMEVHDLQNEYPLCQIPEIKPEHKVYFDSLDEARREGYDSCSYCIGASSRGVSPGRRAPPGPIEPERPRSKADRGG